MFYRRKSYYRFLKKRSKIIRLCSINCYAKWQSINRQGKNNSAYITKRQDLITLKKSRIGIPIRGSSKRKQRKKILEWWKSEEGLKQRIRLSKINKNWAKKIPKKKDYRC